MQAPVDANAGTTGQGATSAATAGTAAPAATGQQDALDKGVDTILTKLGKKQSGATTEKISDGIRSLFKKVTGKDVPIADKQ